MKSKLAIVALLAFAAGGTCPSDVNNDGTVGINDVLAVLAAWGPCPQAKVVGVGSARSPGQHHVVVRIWSDGVAEYKVTVTDPDWEPQVWTPLPVNPNAPQSQPIAAAGNETSVYRLWADGSVDSIRFHQNPNIVLPVKKGWITEPN